MNFEAVAAEVMRQFVLCSGGKMLETGSGVAGICGDDIPLHALKGLNEALDRAELMRVRDFYFDHGIDATLELAPWVATPMAPLLLELGFEKASEEYVMARRAEAGVPVAERLENTGEWAAVLSHAFFGELTPLGERLGHLMGQMQSAVAVGLRVEGQLAAAGQLTTYGDAALLAGDGTLAAYRGRGLQQTLIRDRMARAAADGCPWVHAEVLPGSSSHRNYERCGFQNAYSRVHFVRRFPAT